MSTCAACKKPLTLFIQDDEEDDSVMEGSSTQPQGEEVPDDLTLSCSCHFHWQCLLDAYEMTTCPSCKRDISHTTPDGQTKVICNLENEGGLQKDLDILPILSEELYLKAYPEERKPRAFLEFCREGDIEAVVDLIKANDDDGDSEDEDDMADSAPIDTATVLRYQDPVSGMRSALHIAVEHQKVEVVWLLLLLASTLAAEHFPAEVQEAAQRLEVSRAEQSGKADIRTLKDSEGKVAVEHADESFRSLFDVALLVGP